MQVERRILIIESDMLLRETLSGLLEYEGYAVRTATDGQIGRGLLALERQDILLADVDGTTTEDELNRIAALQEEAILVVAMTAIPRAQPGDGTALFLQKPFCLDDLLDVLKFRQSRQ